MDSFILNWECGEKDRNRLFSFHLTSSLLNEPSRQERKVESLPSQPVKSLNADIPKNEVNIQKTESKEVVKSSEQEVKTESAQKSSVEVVTNKEWASFLQQVEELDDPLLTSIFRQGQFSRDAGSSKIVLFFQKDQTFFKEWLDSMEPLWKPHLKTLFGDNIELVVEFIREPSVEKKNVRVNQETSSFSRPVSSGFGSAKRESYMDISDPEVWKKAQALQRVFGGTVKEIKVIENE